MTIAQDTFLLVVIYEAMLCTFRSLFLGHESSTLSLNLVSLNSLLYSFIRILGIMEDYDHLSDVACSKFATIKRGTLNKKWKLEFDNFQIPLPVDQATFAFAVATIHTRLKIDFILNNVGSHYRTLKA